jgi:penicillin amidase
MRLLAFLISLAITLALTFALETPFGTTPALGRFLDPNHGFWQNAEPSEWNPEDELIDAPLKGELSILIDKHLIPHIYAQNDADLYFAQGYMMAKHRLWQMDFQVRAAAGRVSEIIGKDAIDFDRLQRRKGMVFGAENGLREVENDPQIIEIIENFTAGFNFYVENLQRKDYPVEYKLLGYDPEPWEPIKSLLFLKYMADMLAGYDTDLENTNFVELFGKDRYDFLFPDRFGDADPVIPEGTKWNFKPVEVAEPKVKGYPWSNVSEPYEKPDPANGSNNWAVHGTKTAGGRPILAGDPHLSLNLPSIWYMMHLNSPTVNVMGAALPGAPGIIIGFNDHVAWSVTNATRDVRDWYKIEFRDNTRQEYYFDGNWLKSQLRIEEIKVKGADAVLDSVVYTHHGPVVYDDRFSSNGKALEGYSLRWIAHEGSKEVLTFYHLNRAKNYQDYTNALKYYVAPAQNFAFASKDGDIALWIQGKFPLKWEGQGQFLMDGSQKDHEWQGYIPSSHNPHVLNPERGFISSANQQPHDRTYPYWGYDSSYEAWRNRRINQKLAEMEKITARDMMSFQNDNYNLKAAEITPLMLEMLNKSSLTDTQSEILKDIANWDYFNEIGSKGASAWEIWWDKIRKLTNSKYTKAEKRIVPPGEWRLQQLLVTHPNDPHFDLEDTPEVENAVAVVNKAFGMAVDSLMRWKEKNNADFEWAMVKNTTIQHLLPPLSGFSVSGVPVGGNRNIVNATSSRHGASWRMVVELKDTPIGFGVYPGGQSGNPGSAYYDNLIPIWAAGKYLDLVAYPSKDASKYEKKYTINFKPGSDN